MNQLKSIKTLLVGIAAAIGMFASTAAHAGNYGAVESVYLPGSNFGLSAGSMTSVPLYGWKHVRKLYVQGYGIGCATTVEVIVNGDVKGTIYFPGSDPSYVVTVEEAARSVELRNLGPCNAHVQSIMAIQSVATSQYQHGHNPGLPSSGTNQQWDSCPEVLSDLARTKAAAIAAEAIRSVDALRPYTNLGDYGTYLLPIKKLAARVYAKANARGDLSLQVNGLLAALRGQIDLAEPYLQNSFELDAAFNLAVGLLSIREQIDAVIQ